MNCPFCNISIDQILLESEYSYAKYDGFPVANGHALIISKRHVSNYFDLKEEEQVDMLKLMNLVKIKVENEYGISQYNIGVNCGEEAGQTINHVHMHLIPRYKGDVDDARGGVRWVIPSKAKYWDE